jgi:hypothetical protein
MKSINFYLLGGVFVILSMITMVVSSDKGISAELFMSEIEALSAGESGGYSCTVTTNCVTGSIQCTGTQECSRTAYTVTCDGKTTEC